MTQQTAQKVANIAIGAAVVGAAYVILKHPPLRRLAVGLVLSGLTGGVPAWLTRELQQAWVESGQRSYHEA